MGWFRRTPKQPDPGDVGAFLASYVPSLMTKPGPVEFLRSMLDSEDVSEDMREAFDVNAFFFVMFVAFVAARQRFSEATSEKILEAAIAPMLASGDDRERELVRQRYSWFREQCPPSENLSAVLASLTYICLVSLFDNEADDGFFRMETAAAVASLHKMFDEFFEGVIANR